MPMKSISRAGPVVKERRRRLNDKRQCDNVNLSCYVLIHRGSYYTTILPNTRYTLRPSRTLARYSHARAQRWLAGYGLIAPLP